MTRAIDLNCDLGEGAGQDEALMPLITSANIACGAHAGDEATMRAMVRLARQHGVAIGAHPGFADRAHFGRRELVLGVEEAGALVREQVTLLRAIARDEGAVLAHVKPHGALYNMAARDVVMANAIAAAVAGVDRDLRLFGLAGSALLAAGRAHGLRVVSEVFADRSYQADGSLTPRANAGALIEDEAEAFAQVLRMVREGAVCATDGTRMNIAADTVCLHGDGRCAVKFGRGLRESLAGEGVVLRAPA